jgi:esterase/lipase superfamily enzyme
MAQLFTERPELRARFRELMLIAPDIDADVFRRDIAPLLQASERPVTLYVSANDKALQASKALHGYPRLGEASDPMHLIPGIETLDASALETDFLGHSYYSYAGSVLVDIKEIMQGVGRAAQRSRLEEIVAAVGRYWRLRP